MADDDWESRTEFDDLDTKPVILPSDKWAGEDEEDVKDNWDDEDESAEKKPEDPESAENKAFERKKKKNILKLIAEKGTEKMAQLTLSPEELAAQKIRDEKLREQAELQSMKEAFGSSAINEMDPITKDDFDALRKRILCDLLPFEKRAPYQDFVEDLIQDLALVLPAKRLKKVKTTVEALYFEKTKAEKASTGKGPKGGQKSKAKLNVEGDRNILKGGMDDDFVDEFEDFM